MKSWALLLLLAMTHLGTEFVYARWHAFTAMLGLTCAFLLWHARGARFSMIWWVCMWGVFESFQVFVCQGIGIGVETKQFEGMCQAITGLPLFTIGLMCIAALAALWLDRNKR